MKNPNSHILLYAKGHYKKNDIWEDLGKIVAERCALPMIASKRDVFQVVIGVTIDLILESPNRRNKLKQFITNASAFRFAPFDLRHENHDSSMGFIEACLIELMQLPVKDEKGNILIELDEANPEILPLSEDSKRLITKEN